MIPVLVGEVIWILVDSVVRVSVFELVPVLVFGVVQVYSFVATHVWAAGVFPLSVGVVFLNQVSFVTVVPVLTRISLTDCSCS